MSEPGAEGPTIEEIVQEWKDENEELLDQQFWAMAELADQIETAPPPRDPE